MILLKIKHLCLLALTASVVLAAEEEATDLRIAYSHNLRPVIEEKTPYTDKNMFWCIMGMHCVLPAQTSKQLEYKDPFLRKGTSDILYYPYYTITFEPMRTGANNTRLATLKYYGPTCITNRLTYTDKYTVDEHYKRLRALRVKLPSIVSVILPTKADHQLFGDEVVNIYSNDIRLMRRETKKLHDVYILKSPTSLYYQVDINGELRIVLENLAPGPAITLGCNVFVEKNVNKYNIIMPAISYGPHRIAVGQIRQLMDQAAADIFKVFVYIRPFVVTEYGQYIGVFSMVKQNKIRSHTVTVNRSGIVVAFHGINVPNVRVHFAVLSTTTVTGSTSVCGNVNPTWFETGFPGEVRTDGRVNYIQVELPLHLAGERVLICGTLDKNIANLSNYTMPFLITVLQTNVPGIIAPNIVNVDALGRATIVLNRLIHPLSEIRLKPSDNDIIRGIPNTCYSFTLNTRSARDVADDEKLMSALGDVSLSPHAIFRRMEDKEIRMMPASSLNYTPAFSYTVGKHTRWSSGPQFFPKMLLGLDKLYKISVCDRWKHQFCLADSDFDKDVGYLVPNPFVHTRLYAEWEQQSIILMLTTSPYYPKVPHITLVRLNPDRVIDYDRVCNTSSFATAQLINSNCAHAISAFKHMFNGAVNYYYQHKYRISGVEEGHIYGICYTFAGRDTVSYSSVINVASIDAVPPPRDTEYKFLTLLNPMRLAKNRRATFRNMDTNGGPVFTTTNLISPLQLKGIYMTEELSYNCSNLFHHVDSRHQMVIDKTTKRAIQGSLLGLELHADYRSTSSGPLPAGFWLPMDKNSWIVGNSRMLFKGKVNATKSLYKICVCYKDGCSSIGSMVYSAEQTFDVSRFINLSLLTRLTVGGHACIYGKDNLTCFNSIGHMKAGLRVPVELNDSSPPINDVSFSSDNRHMLVVREGLVIKYDQNLKLVKVLTTSSEIERIFAFRNITFAFLADSSIVFKMEEESLSSTEADTAINQDAGVPPTKDNKKGFLDLSKYTKVELPGISSDIVALDIWEGEELGFYHIFYVNKSLILHHSTLNVVNAHPGPSLKAKLVSTLFVIQYLSINAERKLIIKATSRVFDDEHKLFVLIHSYGSPNLSIIGTGHNSLDLHGQVKITPKLVDFIAGKNYLLGLTVDISPRGEISHSIMEIPLSRLINTTLSYVDIPTVIHLGEEYQFEPLVNNYQNRSYYTKQKGELAQYGLSVDADTGIIYGTPIKLGVVTANVKGIGDFHTSHTKLTFIVVCEKGASSDSSKTNCVKCPKGTYWNLNKDTISCLKCTDIIKGSTTVEEGSTSIADCMCPPGTYLDDIECKPCPLGTTSSTYGSLDCPLFASTPDGTSDDEDLSVGISCKAGTYLKGDACVACTIGYYCLGGTLQPFRCGYGMTTEKAGASASKDCLCDAGYEWVDGKCSPCARTSYKETIGNIRCTSCPSADDAKGVVYTSSFSATSIRQCMHCAVGYYYDANRLSCSPCPEDSFCPGKGTIPLFCPSNTITKGTNASGRNDCLCVKGYGYASTTRYILSLDNTCAQCPANSFQHMNGTNMPCMQCPQNTYTASAGSTSLGECLPGPGYYALSGDDIKGIATRLESVEPSVLQASTVKCIANAVFDDSISITVLSRSLMSCIDLCKSNIYCRFAYYADAENEMVHTDMMLSGGSSYVAYRPCKMIMAYESFRVPKVVGSMEPLDYDKHRYRVLCEIIRTNNPPNFGSLTVRRCPMNHYCPGGEKFTKFQCPENSTTLMDGASRSSHCLCLPGFELSTTSGLIKCVPCKEGFYKDNTSNASCQSCPAMMTTNNRGSVSASQCVCSVGYFASVSRSALPTTSLLQFRRLPPVLPRTSVFTNFVKNNFNLFGIVGTADVLRNISCKKCPDGYVCPGKWLPNSIFAVHNPPISCPDGSAVPQLSASANSVAKCICKPGYGAGVTFGDDVFLSCQKCAPGTFSETYSTSACQGRCIDYSITFPGASSFKECFCLPGRFMTLQLIEGEEKFVCKKCSDGTICPGGFTQRMSSSSIPDDLKEAIFSHTPQYPRMGYMAIFKRQGGPGHRDVKWMPNRHETYITQPPNPSQFKYYDSAPDIHPCIYSSRCNNFGQDGCVEGSSGYLCGSCTEGYDTRYLQSDCIKCKSKVYELMYLFLPRIILLIFVCIVCHLNNRASSDGNISIITIFKIWYMFTLSLVPLGMQQLTTSSSLVRFYTLYNNYFYKPILAFVHVERLGCWKPALHKILTLLESWGLPIPHFGSPQDINYIHLWYMQRFLALAKPLLDTLLLCILYKPGCLLYSIVKSKTMPVSRMIALDSRIKALNKMVKTGSSSYEEAEEDSTSTETELCVKSLDDAEDNNSAAMVYIKHRSPGSVFLIQQILLLLTLHLPSVVINSLSMLWCGSVKYKDGDVLKVLMHLPDQVCDANNRLFFIGRILGVSNLLLWMFMLGVLFLMLSNTRYGSRSWNTLFMAGCDTGCRWWDAVHLSRQILISCLIVCHYAVKPKGDTEYMRATCYFILHFLYVTLHLTFSPYDKRSNESFNDLESLVLFSNLCMSIFIQGSYLYDFSDFGGFPIVVSLLVHARIIWTIVLEYGHIKFANMKNNGRGEFAKMVIDFMPFAVEHRTANVYYDYKNDNVVMESSNVQVSSRSLYDRLVVRPLLKLAYFMGITSKVPKNLNSCSYSLRNRDFLVACIRNTIERCSMLKHDIVLSDKWFYFIVRYVFWYCHCLHIDVYDENLSVNALFHKVVFCHFAVQDNVSEESLAEFLVRFPLRKLSAHSTVHHKGKPCDGKCSVFSGEKKKRKVCEVAESLLVECLFDTVYDLGPVTLVEFYLGLLSLNHLHDAVVLRMFEAFSSHLVYLKDGKGFHLLREAEELNANISVLKKDIANKTEYGTEALQRYQLVSEIEELQSGIDKLNETIKREHQVIMAGRAAAAVALNLHLGVDNIVSADLSHDDILSAISYNDGGPTQRTGRRKGPYIHEEITADCSYGERCLIKLSGTYKSTAERFGITSNPNGGKHPTMLDVHKNYLEYKMSADTVPQMTSMMTTLVWIPNDKKAPKQVTIGTLWLHNYYKGIKYIAPFGKQKLITPGIKLNWAEPTFHILEVADPKDKGVPDEKIHLSETIAVVNFEDDNFLIDYHFDATKHYGLYSFWNCYEKQECTELNGVNKISLLFHLIPRGVTRFVNVTLSSLSTIFIDMPTANMSTIAADAPIIIARSCKWGHVDSPYMTIKGRATSADTSDSNTTSFKWVQESNAYQISAGDTLMLCWCGVSVDNIAKCSGHNFAIHVGNLYVQPGISGFVTCYQGTACLTYIEYKSKNVPKYFLAQTCDTDFALTFENDSIYFNTSKVADLKLAYLNAKLAINDVYSAGMYVLCEQTENPKGDGSEIIAETNQRIKIRRRMLTLPRYYVNMTGSVTLEFSENVAIYQHITASLSCNNKGYIATSTLFPIKGTKVDGMLQGGILKVCWCKPYDQVLCDRHEDFNVEVGEIFYSGFRKTTDLYCGIQSFCTIRLGFWSFYDTVQMNKRSMPKDAKFSVQKSTCDYTTNDENILSYDANRQDEIVRHIDFNYVMKNELLYTGIVNHTKPGKYNLCYKMGDQNSDVNIAHVTILGPFSTPTRNRVFLGKMFNIYVRSNYVVKVKGFLTNDSSCNLEILDNRYDVFMKKTPIAVEDHMGSTVLVWPNILILRSALGRQLETNGITMSVVSYFMCISTPSGNHSTGHSYTTIGSRVLSRYSANGPHGFSDIRRHLTGFKYTNLLVVRYINRPPSLESCEYNGWRRDIKDLLISLYTRYDESITRQFPTLIYSTNTYVCGCMGESCHTFGDFRTTILFPQDIQPSLFQIMPYDMRPIRKILVGPYLSYMDRMKLVVGIKNCGQMEIKDLYIGGATDVYHPKSPVKNNTDTSVTQKDHGATINVQWMKKQLRYIWESSNLPVVNQPGNQRVLYQMCFCPFLSQGSCRSLEDYTEWVGAVIKDSPRITKGHMLRITILPSDHDYRLPQCNANVAAQSSVTYFDAQTSDHSLTEFISDYLTTHHSNYKGFFLEVCEAILDERINEIPTYRRVFGAMHSGYFPMQKIYITIGVTQDVVLYGNQLSSAFFVNLTVIRSFGSCDSITKNIKVTSSKLVSIVHPNYAVFRNIRISEPGTYKFCVRIRPLNLRQHNALAAFSYDQLVDSSNTTFAYDSQPIENRSSSASPKPTDILTDDSTIPFLPDPKNPQSLPVTFGVHRNTKGKPEEHWGLGGIVEAVDYQVFCLPDILLLPYSNSTLPFDTKPHTVDSSCSSVWYHNYSVLCVLAKHRVAIVSDCTNVLWLVHLPIYGRSSRPYVIPQRLTSLEPVQGTRSVWITCKAFTAEHIIFLGSKHIVSMTMPEGDNGGNITYQFPHRLHNPMDFTNINDVILVSDEYTRTLFAFKKERYFATSGWQKRELLTKCYHKRLYSINRADNKATLFAVDALENTVTRYEFNADNYELVSQYIFDGLSTDAKVNAAPISNLCCIDGFIDYRDVKRPEVLLIGEGDTGRLLVLTVEDTRIELSKIINTDVVLSSVNFVNKKELLLSTWRIYHGHRSNCLLQRTIASYVNLSFYYSVLNRYTIGTHIELVPVVMGDKFDFFFEATADGDEGKSTLESMGLILDKKTGVITGSMSTNGCRTIDIGGGNFLKQKIHKMELCGVCPPSHQFNKEIQKCEQCPIGFYRNDESVETCFSCEKLRKNSTTLMVGARVGADCLCDKHYYLKNNECVPCETGTFKSEVGNAPCAGRCGANRTYTLKIVNGSPAYVCTCMRKYFDQEIALKDWEHLSVDMWNILGITFNSDTNQPSNLDILLSAAAACIPCPVGYYCPGDESLPIRCPSGYTTKDTASDNVSSCVCDRGYAFFRNIGCRVCSGFGYKDVVGNRDCRLCQDDGSVPTSIPLLPPLGPIKIVTEAMWDEELAGFRLSEPYLYPALSRLLTSITLFADTEHAMTQDRCQYCIGGTYFDVNTRYCVECPTDRFCPGGDYQPLSCGSNAVTKVSRSVTGMDCFCEKGYGNTLGGRHPTTGGVACYYCPVGQFQHLQFVDYNCLPCPDGSSTYSTGATSLLMCSPESGNYLSVTRQHRGTLVTTDLLEVLGNYFEDTLSEQREDLSIKCTKTLSSSIYSFHREKVNRDSMETCKATCVRDIYCSGYSFEPTIRFVEYDSNTHNANETIVFNGLRFLKRSYGTCTLYFFTLKFKDLLKKRLEKTSINDIVYICRVYDPVYEYEFLTKPCPKGYYCPGGSAYTRCPDNSTTMDEGAFNARQCLCLPGYEPSTAQNSVCVPCSIGSYKQEIGNVSCKRCPDRFRTFKTGAKYITDCACSPGYYADYMNGGVDRAYQSIYKRMKDNTILPTTKDDVLTFFVRLLQERHTRRHSIYPRSNPYRIMLPKEVENPHSHIESLIYLSEGHLLLPQNAPSAVICDKDRIISCKRCKPYHYCPGGWASSSPERMIHNIPYRCPEGSNVPTESTNATSISQCLCLPGYRLNIDAPEGASSALQKLMIERNAKLSLDDYNWFPKIATLNPKTESGTKPTDTTSDVSPKINTSTVHLTFSGTSSPTESSWLGRQPREQCVKCEAGMYKEGQENSSCSGRCMQYATTYGGAVSPKQCFCNYGRYMTLDDTLGSMQLTCARCLKGAVCPGGLSDEVIQALKYDRNYTDIRIYDHRRPMARFGYFAAFKEQGVELWSPVTQSPSTLQHISTDMLDFHACPLEYMCTSDSLFPCEKGSTGYLCMNCVKGYERSYFRSNCLQCDGILNAILLYLKAKVLLWIVASSILYLLHKKLYYQYVIIKIWLEFWFSMVPYGIFPLNSSSSLKRYATQYRAVFGYQQRLFTYVRVKCLFERFSTLRLSTFQSWYTQRLLIIIQPLSDGIMLYLILQILRALSHAFGTLSRQILRRYSSASTSAASVSSYDESIVGDGQRNLDPYARSRSQLGDVAISDKKPVKRRYQWLELPRCFLVMYYLSFQFICQELLQTLWCVPVQYKNESPIKVLLYMPSLVCNYNDHLFLIAMVVSCSLLATLSLILISFVFWSVRKRRYMHLFSSGRQRHTLSWDAVLFIRRFLVATVAIFQPHVLSTGASEKLRMIGSLLITVLLLILHLSVLPYQVRDDNLFNRLELFSMLLNCLTGFIILGSFNYDFNYSGLLPLGASMLYSCLLLWYMLVECGFISDLRPALRRRLGIIPNFWAFCRKLLLWHCHSHITFDYNTGNVVIERPFTGHASSRDRSLTGHRNPHVTDIGRRALCLCIEQSVSRYVMEQRNFSVPIYWEEFLVRYSFAYKYLNTRLRCGNVVGANVRVTDIFASEMFDDGPINPWQMSIATLNVPISTLVSCYKEFESTKLGLIYDLKCRYSALCVNATESLSYRDTDVREMIAKVHELENLRKRKARLQIEVASHLRNAREGQRVTFEVQDFDAGIGSLVDTVLTNEEILEKIAAVTRRKRRLNPHSE
ncbi:cysteine repeat modular [Babesia ovis]|uniref:Cysteine repeat modular n=1 Tax=Babesia ovis TaxID=5869 RepID=A0A9W5TCB8_BABOV|nr:cysteine repeat modular [Babesia ovis]